MCFALTYQNAEKYFTFNCPCATAGLVCTALLDKTDRASAFVRAGPLLIAACRRYEFGEGWCDESHRVRPATTHSVWCSANGLTGQTW